MIVIFLQRSSTDQANISSKFETLGGELDEKRKLDLNRVFKFFSVYHFKHKLIITVFNKLNLLLWIQLSNYVFIQSCKYINWKAETITAVKVHTCTFKC